MNNLQISTVTHKLDASNPSAKLIGLEIYLAIALPPAVTPASFVESLLISFNAVTNDNAEPSIIGDTASLSVDKLALRIKLGNPNPD